MGEQTNKYDAFFFDMDGTLTKSKTEIEDKHLKLLLKLAFKHPVIAVSGAVFSQMVKQLIVSNIAYLSQSGNMAMSSLGEMLWNHALTESEYNDILAHIEEVASAVHVPVDDEHVQHRGCQVSFSLVGHDADLQKKAAYDPTWSRRTAILQAIPFVNTTLTVRIGGTTCFDYTKRNGTKGSNVKDYIERFQFKHPVYVGDALFPGGNDESVMTVCDTVQVNSVEETYDFISKHI